MPEHAILGFVTAANLLIALGQFHEMLGVDKPPGHGTLAKLIGIAQEIPQTQWTALAVGLVTLALMLGFDRFSRKFPVTLCAVIAAALAALALDNWIPGAPHIQLVRDVAPIPSGFPLPRVYTPNFDLMLPMLPGAAAVAIIGLLESASISSTLALKNKSKVNFNQEFFGQGMAQIATAFFSGFPGSASYSRSALIERNGGQTMLAGVFFSAMTLLALLIGARFLGAIPLTALAALLVFTGIKLVDVAALKRVWNFSRADFIVVALTFGVTFFVNLQWGFFVGIVAALLVFVARAKTLQLYELLPRESGKWEERLYTPDSAHPRSGHRGIGAARRPVFRHGARAARTIGRSGARSRAEVDHHPFAPRDFGGRLGVERLGRLRRDLWRERRPTDSDRHLAQPRSPHRAHRDQRFGRPGQPAAARNESVRAFEKGLERILAELGPENPLSPEWKAWAQKHKRRDSVSFWRDGANDPATLGAVEL